MNLLFDDFFVGEESVGTGEFLNSFLVAKFVGNKA